STFSPLNPFSVGIAQKFAELPLLSAAWYRLIFMALALIVWIWGTMRHARRHERAGVPSADLPAGRLAVRHVMTLLGVLASFVIYIVGTLRYDWGFEELSALFLLM